MEEQDAGATYADIKRLYSVAIREFKETTERKSGSHYYAKFWASLAPTGSIYYHNGLRAERYKNSEDLWAQLHDLADKRQELLGASATIDQRIDVLLGSLKETKVSSPHEESMESMVCFPPLIEFFSVTPQRFGPFIFPRDATYFADWVRDHVVAFVVMALQVLAPTLVFWNRWSMDTNYMRDPVKLFKRLTWREAICLGPTAENQATTVMGVLLVLVVTFIVHCYSEQQRENCKKSEHLPLDPFWFITGNLVNAWCCLFTVLSLPVLFWSEETPTNIVLDSMTLLFIQSLDDLGDVLCKYVGMTDQDFQRIAVWNSAVLSQCPVLLTDLVNPIATRAKDIWCIKFDMYGQLLSAKGRRCQTRLDDVAQDESAPLRREGKKRRHYYRTSSTYSKEIPSYDAIFVSGAWRVVTLMICVLQFVLPPLWFIVNKPCYT